MSFPRYSAYKESKNDWVVHVPEHWELMPCRGFVDERTEKNEDAACQSYLSLMANVGIIPYEEKGDIGNKKPEDLSKCKIVYQGDFVINSMNYGIGSYGVSAYEGVCSPVYIVLTPRQDVVEPGFAFRVFEDKSFQAYAQSLGNGILAHRCAIGWDDLKGIVVGIPSAAEQKSILIFLDRETAKIDALISEQKRLIELLQEKRQAVISHAVTKGLNPNAPMKDSGVEWLGEVPEHWEVLELKRLNMEGSSITYGIVQAGPHQENGVPYIRTSDMSGDRLLLETCQRTSPEIDEAYARSKVSEGDLVIAIRATVGKTLEVPKELDGANLTQGTAKFSPGERVTSGFMKLAFASSYSQAQIASIAKGATFLEITLDALRRLAFAVPPKDEARQITHYLSERCAVIDTLTTNSEEACSLLKERRSALISAAVTGQIDVRGLAAEVAA